MSDVSGGLFCAHFVVEHQRNNEGGYGRDGCNPSKPIGNFITCRTGEACSDDEVVLLEHEIGVVEHIGRTGVEIAHGHTAVDFAEDCNFGTVGELVEVSGKGEGFKECATFIGDRDGFSSVGAEEENLECVETDHYIGVFDKVSVDESFGNGVL